MEGHVASTGDNAMDADNQQERLSHTEAARWFLAGFIEGEGALCVGVKAHPTTRSGYYVDPEFYLYQHVSGRRILDLPEARQSERACLCGDITPEYREGGSPVLRTVRAPIHLQAGDLREVSGDRGADEPKGTLHAERPGSHRRKGVCDESRPQREKASSIPVRRARENPQRLYAGPSDRSLG